jgi:hemerythrin-like domain-containing protein
MSQVIETLMHEHRVIEGVLGALDSLADAVARDDAVEREIVADFARFFREFADRCHHGKEEKQLFVALVNAGFPREQGPIAVMLGEHEQGREHVRALAAIGTGRGPLSAEERKLLTAHASEFVFLLRNHIRKEDGVLFPMAETHLAPSTLADLAERFEAFERDVMGADEHERLQALADRLVAAYPPQEGADITPGCPHPKAIRIAEGESV